MKKTIKIDPITGISGFLETKVEVEKNTIVNAETSGLLSRGFENMLKSRQPLDAIYFTERICGICSTAHALASTVALENALKVEVSVNDLYIRDLMHGFELIQNHLRHFYNLTIPSYVKMQDINPLYSKQYSDYRLPQKINDKISEHYISSIQHSRLAHEGLAVLGGKVPRAHGIFVGGVTINIDAYKLSKVEAIIYILKQFIDDYMIEDVYTISKYYSDYFEKGKAYGNFMSYGLFDKYIDPQIRYVKPSVLINGQKSTLDSNKITENITRSWCTSNKEIQKSVEDTEDSVNLSKEGGYSFIKSPHYDGRSMEVGPLARLILAGEYSGGSSCMDRIIARVLETKKIINIMEKLVERIQLVPNNEKIYDIPDQVFGAGLVDTTRGALGHWVKIENKLIKYYNIIAPTAWNMGCKDGLGRFGVGEKSLVGTKINNVEEPVEIGRIITSFDTCISCIAHLTSDRYEPIDIEILI